MPPSSNPHRAEAERLLRPVREDPPIPPSDGDVAEAQVHASLAIAAKLADIHHQLEELNVRLDRG